MKTAVYQPLLNQIETRIRQGELGAGDMIGTEVQLASRSGISRDSVRRGIEQLIERGLIERRPGKGLYVRPLAKVREIQVVLPNLLKEQSALIARGAKAAGADRGIRVQVYDAHGSGEHDVEAVQRLPQSSADGAIIAMTCDPRLAEALFRLKLSGYPFVLVDQRLEGMDVPTVGSDNYGGGYAAGKQLVELGHRCIGFIGDLKAETVRRRMEGMRDAVLDAQLPFDRSLVVQLDVDDPLGDWTTAIRRCVREMVTRTDRPSAIFFHNDEVAATAYQVIKEQGLGIPADVSVVGFDGNSLGQWLDPTLTTVRQPSEEIGRMAMELLLARLDSSAAPVESRVLPTQWIERASTAPPRG